MLTMKNVRDILGVSYGVIYGLIRDAMRQISLEAQAIVELLDTRIQNEHLDGSTEAEDVRSVLELIQSLTLEVSENLDAYQQRYSGS